MHQLLVLQPVHSWTPDMTLTISPYIFPSPSHCSPHPLSPSMNPKGKEPMEITREKSSVNPKDKEPMEITREKIVAGYAASNALKRIGWTDEESSLLADLVKQHGEKNWALIARNMGRKTAKQCRERWINHLHPDVKKGRWSAEEVRRLTEAHKIHGNIWVKIAKHTQGRTENAVKNYFNSTKRMKDLRLSGTENEESYVSSKMTDCIDT